MKSPPRRCEARLRLRFASLVTINALDYKFKLTAAFQKALDDQEAAVTLYYAHLPVPGAHPPQHLTKQKTTSPLSPTGRLWDHPPLRG